MRASWAHVIGRVGWSLVAACCIGLLPSFAQQRPRNWRQLERERQAHNAARLVNGGRVSLQFLNPEGGSDRATSPQDSADGNPHTRCVTWAPPFLFRIDLVAKLPVTEISFICSDYASEQSPKEIEVTLSDGTTIAHSLEVVRPKDRNDRPRQTIPVGKELEWFEVKVLSRHAGGANPKTGKPINWGGVGEIEALTSADLTPYLEVPNHNSDAPVFVQGGSPRSDYSNVTVNAPSAIPLGEHPGIFLTRAEIVAMRDVLTANVRATPMHQALLAGCREWLDKEIVHPDPNVPAQMRDRSDAQAKAHSMMSKMAGWLGWAYQLTDNDAYATKAHEILVGYAKLYPDDYKEHKGVHSNDTSKVMAQRLSEAMWLLPLIQSYDLVYHAPCMTPADRQLIETDLFRRAITFINRKRTGEVEVASREQRDPNWRTADPTSTAQAVGNWMNFYNAAYIQAGIVMGDQNWIDIGAADTRSMIVRGIGDDGLWKEGTIGYQLFARQALVACMEPLARKGVDLYGYAECRAKNLWDSGLKFAYPDGTAPGINDSGRSPVAATWTAMAYDYGWLRYRDPNYGAIVNTAPRQIFQSEGCYFPTVVYEDLPETELAALGSVVFESLGYAILRGTENGQQTFLLMDYGPHGGGHGHPDKLNLILFADGDELAGEPQPYRYEDARHGEWTRPTIAHWTVSVDEHSQAPTTAKLLAFYDAGGVKVMRGVSSGAYAGVGLDRTVVQIPGYVVDIFRVWSNAEHTYDYPLCFRGSLDVLAGADAAGLKPMGPPATRGYKHIAVGTPVPAPDNWVGTWIRPPAESDRDAVGGNRDPGPPATNVKVTVLGTPNTVVYAGRDVDERHRVIVRRAAKETVFSAVVDPYKGTDTVRTVETIPVSGTVPAYGIKILRNDGGSDLVVVRFDPQSNGVPGPTSTFGPGNSDALVSVIRLDPAGKPTELGMVGGTRLAFDGEEVVSTPGIKWSKR